MSACSSDILLYYLQETEKDNQESDSNWLFTYGTSEATFSTIDKKP
jgi:hypothetical protein